MIIYYACGQQNTHMMILNTSNPIKFPKQNEVYANVKLAIKK